MLTRVEALRYRCLRTALQSLGSFHILVGPNASGKTTFLDVISFLGDLTSSGLDGAIEHRSSLFNDLVWNRKAGTFELAIEMAIPEARRERLAKDAWTSVRYEVAIGPSAKSGETSILSEKVLLRSPRKEEEPERDFFPSVTQAPKSILTPKTSAGSKTVVNKIPGGNDNFYAEVGGGWAHAFKLGPKKSALANLPDDEFKFPVSTWLKRLLQDGIQQFILNSRQIRRPSPPGQVSTLKSDGSNLPWVINSLQHKNPKRFREWIAHLETVLPDLKEIRTVERKDDRSRYLVLKYTNGVEVPSWMVSDGTLRLLALTLPSYLEDFSGIYLIEEPENGIHPRAVEAMFQSLSTIDGAQILMATHSPVILNLADAKDVLCFAKAKDGATDIVVGDRHPRLRNWKREENLGVLFAAGVLG